MTVNSDPTRDPAGEVPQPQPRSPSPPPAAMGLTRLGGLGVMLALGAVILVLLLVFILMNGQHVQVHLYGAHWDAPLGVALLFAAALGLLLVVVPGAGRIFQLRRAGKRLHREREVLADRLDRSASDAAASAPDSGVSPDGGVAGDGSGVPAAEAVSNAPTTDAGTPAAPSRTRGRRRRQRADQLND